MMIVDENSACMKFGELIQIDENHINVNKPMSRSDPSYSKLVNFILESSTK